MDGADLTVPVIAGPTAVGKSAVGLALAALAPIEIISADSRQVYRGLDIGTAKPTPDERARVPHHGLDVVDPGERYSAGRFARDAVGWIRDIRGRGRLPVVVGGTGFYLRALFDGLFDEPPLDGPRRARLAALLGAMPPDRLRRWAARLGGVGERNRHRAMRAVEVALLTGRPLGALHRERPAAPSGLRPRWFVLGLARDQLDVRIRARTAAMLDAGLVDEVRGLIARGVPRGAPGLTGVGYREVLALLDGRLPADALAATIALRTRQYAKRQVTWFRGQLPADVVALDAAQPAATLARAVLSGYRAAHRK